MSKKPLKLNLPLRNITSTLNLRKMSYTGDSGFSDLTNSPMSNLAFNLSELSTGRSTPRRRLSLCSDDSPSEDCDTSSSEIPLSAESGCFSESPRLVDSPTYLESLSLHRFTTSLHPEIPLEAFSIKKKTIAFRRISSQPLPTLRLDSPTEFLDEDRDKNDENCQSGFDTFGDEACSQDSGLGLDNEQRFSRSNSDDSTCTSTMSTASSPSCTERLPCLEDVWNSMGPSDFKAPKGKPPKRTRSLVEYKQHSEETCSPLKYSPVKSSSLPRPFFSGIPKALFSETSDTQIVKKNASLDDGFQELFEIEDLKTEAKDQLSSLISATLLHRPGQDKNDNIEIEHFNSVCPKKVSFTSNTQEDTPSSRPIIARRNFLQRSQSMDVRPRPSFKRSEPPQDGITPIQNKKWRGDDVVSSTTSICDAEKETVGHSNQTMSLRRLQRCHSETEAQIKTAVSRMFSEPDLIGDSSRPYCLPVVKGKHQDLKSITPETLSRLLTSEFEDLVEEFHIIDCRYPYEYEGGHIQSALNIYTKEKVIERFLKGPITVKDPSKRMILIFHCEFSSERGPGLFRFLRKQDRETNKECYPFLHYPEIYLLEGGYKNFFEKYSHLCEPQRYKQMVDKNHSEDLRKCRAKCKSWADERSQRGGIRTLKF